jgi:L-alanine-DL-glutamate epimerase-like enolase superfamily enzyme
MAAAARAYVEKGFRAVKFGWGVFGEDPGRDRELVAAARAALGPERDLLVDPGWYAVGWADASRRGQVVPRTRDDAVAMCEWLAQHGVGWVEDFIHPELFEDYAYVRARSAVPVAAGEQLATIWDFERFVAMGCADVIQPDVSRCGGVSVAAKLVGLAEAAGIDVVPHSWLTHLLTGFSLQLIATLKQARFVEFNVSQSALTRGITRTELKLETDGTVAIPDEPAIGVAVDTDFVRAHRVN